MNPFNQQLDIDGGRHDIAPAHETVKLFDSATQIRGQVALDTDWCDEAACPTSQCIECKQPLTKSFYVRRVSADGREGWTGSLRPLSRATREAQAWLDSGWTVEVVPNTPAIRAKVRTWERESRARRAAS